MMKRSLLAAYFSATMFVGIFPVSGDAAQDLPKRIVSLAPSMTEELYLLGADSCLVGCTTYCVTPPEARNKEKVGAITTLDMEKIVALKPDLVLATSLTNPKAIQKLEDLKIEVKVFSAPKDFTSLCTQFLELGRAVGRERQAQEIIATAKGKVDAIKARTSGLNKPNVFIEIGARPLFTANRDYFINDFVEMAGGTNIASDAKIGVYSREEVVRRGADVILIVTMGIAGEKEEETWRTFTTLKAVKEKRIHIIDSRKICSPTPVTFVETLEEITALLHPELSKRGYE